MFSESFSPFRIVTYSISDQLVVCGISCFTKKYIDCIAQQLLLSQWNGSIHHLLYSVMCFCSNLLFFKNNCKLVHVGFLMISQLVLSCSSAGCLAPRSCTVAGCTVCTLILWNSPLDRHKDTPSPTVLNKYSYLCFDLSLSCPWTWTRLTQVWVVSGFDQNHCLGLWLELLLKLVTFLVSNLKEVSIFHLLLWSWWKTGGLMIETFVLEPW